MKRTRISIVAGLMFAGLATAVQAADASTEQAEARTMMGELVAFPSIAGSQAVQDMAGYLGRKFLEAGFSAQDIERLPASEGGGLLIRYRGASGSTKAPVVFLAHMDVVPAQREDWATDPWELTEKEGALYGRGVVDNKYGLLTISQAFLRLRREGFVPDRDLVAAFSGDEETDMRSARLLAERLKGAAYALNSDAGGGFRNADGTGAYVYQAAEKTYASFELTVRNPGGHSSAPRDDNAIYSLASGLTRLANHRFPVRWNEVTLAAFSLGADPNGDELARATARFIEQPGDPHAVSILEKLPDANREIRTTCVPTLLRAGTVENALPTTASATINCRIFPGETVDETRAALLRVVDDSNVEITVSGEPLESPVSSMPPEVLSAFQRVLATRLPGAFVAPYLEAGATDGLHFRRAGISTIGLGPLIMTGDSNFNFHGNDERLPVDQFRDGLDHYYQLIKHLTGGDRAH